MHSQKKCDKPWDFESKGRIFLVIFFTYIPQYISKTVSKNPEKVYIFWKGEILSFPLVYDTPLAKMEIGILIPSGGLNNEVID